jgi:hypothetical protein
LKQQNDYHVEIKETSPIINTNILE